MLIIDGATDYYDFAGAGIDRGIVYDRRHKPELEIDGSCGLPAAHQIWAAGPSVNLKPFFALVGGYGVPGLLVEAEECERRTQSFYHYRAGPAIDQVEGLVKQQGRFAMRKIKADRTALEAHIERGLRDLSELCIEHRLITGLLVRKVGGAFRRDDIPGARFVPLLLSQMGLQEVLQGYEANMLVARFVGGVLPTGPKLEEISDRSRIVKAGFDLKQSFRTRKSA